MAVNNINKSQIQSMVEYYVNSYLKNSKNIFVGESFTIGTRLPGSDVGENSLTVGVNNAAQSPHSIAMGSNNIAGNNSGDIGKNGNSSIAFGDHTRAFSNFQLVHGKYNKSDSNNRYAHIVGGGDGKGEAITEENTKNIYALDWEGNAEFAGTVKVNCEYDPETETVNGEELATVNYIDKNIAIKFFPYHRVDEDTIKIYVDELDPYTIYKVKMDGKYEKIVFYVRSPFGDIPFINSDSSINKYNMFVSNKTEQEMTFIVNSEVYTIDLKTGRVIKKIDGSFAGPDFDEEGNLNLNFAEIDDEGGPNPNKTWSSAKITEELANDFNEARITMDENKNSYLILTRHSGEEVSLQLPVYIPEVNIKEADIERWNKKMDNPTGGKVGQIMGLTATGPAWIDPIGSGEGSEIIAATASQIGYVSNKPGLDTVQKALDALLYEAPNITSFTADKSFERIRELGDKVDIPITFSWDYTSFSNIDKITLSYVPSIVPTAKSAIYSAKSITSDTTFILTITDQQGGSASESGSYSFGLAKYYGVSVEPAAYNEAFVKGLQKKIGTGKGETITVNAAANQYIYYCIPCKWGTPIFNVGGFDGGFDEVSSFNITNTYGHTELYSVWRSDNYSLGKTTVVIR